MFLHGMTYCICPGSNDWKFTVASCADAFQYADRFAMAATAGGSTNVAAALGVSDDGPGPKVEDVGKALDWWTVRAVQTDAEQHRLELEGRRYDTGLWLACRVLHFNLLTK